MEKNEKKTVCLFVGKIVVILVLLAFAHLATGAHVANWDFENDLTDAWGDYDGTGYSVLYKDRGIGNTAPSNGAGALFLAPGNGGYVTVPDNANFRPESFTIMVWVRPSRVNTTQYIISKRSSIYTGYSLSISSTGNLYYTVCSDGGSTTITGPVLQVGQWVHIAARFNKTGTYDSDEVTGTMNLMVNGGAYPNITGVRYKPNSSTRTFTVGAYQSSSTAYGIKFEGLIDDVCFSNSVVSAAAITDYYNTCDIKVRIMTYNILKGGYDIAPSPYNYDRKDELIDFIADYDPDVLLLQECTYWADTGNTRLQEFAEGLSMPYTAVSHNGSSFKVAILSKFPRYIELPAYENPPYSSPFAFAHNIIESLFAPTATRSLNCATVHFGWPSYPYYSQMTDAQKRQSYLNQRATLTGAHWMGYYLTSDFVIAGDWNHNATSPVTYPTDVPNFHDEIEDMGFGLDKLRLYNGSNYNPIDTFYVSPSTRLETIDCQRIESTEYSDHKPNILDIWVKD